MDSGEHSQQRRRRAISSLNTNASAGGARWHMEEPVTPSPLPKTSAAAGDDAVSETAGAECLPRKHSAVANPRLLAAHAHAPEFGRTPKLSQAKSEPIIPPKATENIWLLQGV